MKELVVISGKGGTGKTTLLGSFAALAGGSMLADCDVDAPDLYLLLHPDIHHQEEFRAGHVAVIAPQRCTRCGRCLEVCRFEAITLALKVESLNCEGCGACRVVCPAEAVELVERRAGDWFRGQTKYGPMVYARLRPAEENSGKLVALVRKEARAWAEREGIGLLLTDGPPGIGCPVIASLGNADLALIVTEPSPSGVHDLERALTLCRHFQVPAVVCVNKFDLNPDLEREIRDSCVRSRIPVTESIPFDESVSRAICQGVPLVEFGDGPASRVIISVWREVQQHFLKGGKKQYHEVTEPAPWAGDLESDAQ
jgi:MinD superfamily P-loop ATPase